MANRESTEMHQVNARHEIISGVAFASEGVETNGRTSRSVRDADKRQLQILKDSADPYQTVKGWLLCYLSLTRGRTLV
jgi:hypothetical protein